MKVRKEFVKTWYFYYALNQKKNSIQINKAEKGELKSTDLIEEVGKKRSTNTANK